MLLFNWLIALALLPHAFAAYRSGCGIKGFNP